MKTIEQLKKQRVKVKEQIAEKQKELRKISNAISLKEFRARMNTQCEHQ